MEKRPWNDVSAEARFWGGGRKPRNPRWRLGGSILGPQIVKKREKCHPQNHEKTTTKKTRTLMPKGCQNGAKIDAKTHQKSMQKQVARNMRKILKNHVFPLCKTMQKHRTVVKKQGFARSVCGAGKSSKNFKNDVTIHPNFDEKSMRKR